MTTLASTALPTPSTREWEHHIPYTVTCGAETLTLHELDKCRYENPLEVGYISPGVTDIETFKAAYQVAVLRVRFFQLGCDSNPMIVVDDGEPISEFSPAQQEVIGWLRDNGREVLAEKLVTMLRDADDPDEPDVSIVSLRQMAQFFVKHGDFADPFIGPDSQGLVHAEWRILGNGVLVIVFPEDETVLLVAQADETPDKEKLDLCVRKSVPEIIEAFGDLVPRR